MKKDLLLLVISIISIVGISVSQETTMDDGTTTTSLLSSSEKLLVQECMTCAFENTTYFNSQLAHSLMSTEGLTDSQKLNMLVGYLDFAAQHQWSSRGDDININVERQILELPVPLKLALVKARKETRLYQIRLREEIETKKRAEEENRLNSVSEDLVR